MSDRGAETPTYIAQCTECEALLGAVVADVNRPSTMREALKYRGQWERAGLKVSTVTVQDVRLWAKAKMFEHGPCCRGGKRARRRDEASPTRDDGTLNDHSNHASSALTAGEPPTCSRTGEEG